MSEQSKSKIPEVRIVETEPLDTYWIEGGMGKHVMFTSLVPALVKKSKEGKINIVSAYHDVFLHNPHVANSWNIGDLQYHKEKIKKYVKKIHNYEPYKGDFSINHDLHLCQDWANHYGIEWDNQKDLPQLYIDEKLRKKTLATIKKKLGDKYIVVQFTGGQSPLAYDDNSKYEMNDLILKRNYPYQMARHFINIFKSQYPDYRIVDFSLPNEHPGLPGTIRIPAPYLAFYEIVNHAKTFVGIDSSLAHIAAAARKPGVVIWGGTRIAQFGWPLHTNVTNYDFKSPFNEHDPFYIAVDYYQLFKLVQEKIEKP